MSNYQDYYARYNENTRRLYTQLYRKTFIPFARVQSATHRNRIRVSPEQTGQVRVSVGPRGRGSSWGSSESRRTCWGDGGQSSESALLVLLGPLQASDNVILRVLLFLLPSSIPCNSRKIHSSWGDFVNILFLLGSSYWGIQISSQTVRIQMIIIIVF